MKKITGVCFLALLLLLSSCGPPVATAIPSPSLPTSPNTAASPTSQPVPQETASPSPSTLTATPISQPVPQETDSLAPGPTETAATPVESEGEAGEPQTVSFTTADGLRLEGTLYPGGPVTVVFANMSDSLQRSWDPVVPVIMSLGYTVLTFEWRGLGRSEGRRSFDGSVADLQAAVDFARQNGARQNGARQDGALSQEAAQIVLVGASLGGMATAKIAADGVLAAAILSSPTEAPAPETFAVSDDELAAITAPKLFLNTEGDRFAADTRHMFETAPEPKALHFYSGSAHGTDIFQTGHGEDLVNRLVDFITQYAPLPSRP